MRAIRGERGQILPHIYTYIRHAHRHNNPTWRRLVGHVWVFPNSWAEQSWISTEVTPKSSNSTSGRRVALCLVYFCSVSMFFFTLYFFFFYTFAVAALIILDFGPRLSARLTGWGGRRRGSNTDRLPWGSDV